MENFKFNVDEGKLIITYRFSLLYLADFGVNALVSYIPIPLM